MNFAQLSSSIFTLLGAFPMTRHDEWFVRSHRVFSNWVTYLNARKNAQCVLIGPVSTSTS